MFFLWRANRSRSRGAMLVVVVMLGLVGGVAIASVAGARRTASTFDAYQGDVRFSHVAVNTFIPDLERVEAIAALPGVESSATYLGLSGFPLVDGKVVEDFRYTGVFGSLDGRFFTQDRATVVEGRLPRLDATDEIAFTPVQARFMKAAFGDTVTYVYRDNETQEELARTRYEVVGIVRLPPVLVDEYDIIEGAILPPAATKERLDAFYYAWQGIRLTDGLRGLDGFLRQLETDPVVSQLPAVVQRNDETRAKVQRAVRPQAMALGLFGVTAALAAIALAAQAAARIVNRWSADAAVFRALGLTRRQVTVAAAADAVIAVMGGLAVAFAVAVALSPLAPVGAVRALAPETGVHVDAAALPLGLVVLGLPLLSMCLWFGRRLTATTRRPPPQRLPSAVSAAARANMPLPVVVGMSLASPSGRGRDNVPVRTTMVGTTVAMAATVAALVFAASLGDLASHPRRYGWNWDQLLLEEAGYGSVDPAAMAKLMDAEEDVTGWSLLAFDQMSVEGVGVPVIGLDRRAGAVEPPTVAGRPLGGPGEIALGVTTLSRIGKKVGDTVKVVGSERTEEFHVVGAVTFPAIGVGGADHTSLGRGALVTFDTLSRLKTPGVECMEIQESTCPSAIAFDVAPGANGDEIGERVAMAASGDSPGTTYAQPLTRPADIRNYEEMSTLPVALASLLGGAAIVALIVTTLASVRARRRDLGILKALGATGGLLRRSVAAQALTVAAGACLIGVPVGIAAGRVSWIRFAEVVGVVPVPSVPLATAAVAVSALGACALLAMIPASLAARTTAAHQLRSE